MEAEQQNTEVKEETKVEEKSAVDVDKLMARVEQLESTNQRILDESKDYKNKYRGLRDSVDKDQATKLEESENWKELLDLEKNKTHSLGEQVTQFKKTSLKKELHFQVAKHASDAFDVDDVINSLPKDLLSVDEETLSVQGVMEAVASVKDKKPHLFNTLTKTGMVTARPDGSIPKDKTMDERIAEDPSSMLKELLTESLA